MTFARALWTRVEAVHAVTYFASESRDAARTAGLRGFWMGYFGFRAAPLGPVPASVVEAAFYNFAPAMVRRSIPDAWSFARPEQLVDVRTASAAAALRSASSDVDAIASLLVPQLTDVARQGRAEGRPLFAANAALAARTDPVEALWQACTSIREHRGDGHVAALVTAELDGLEAHVLLAAEQGVPVELLRDNRGWTDDDWRAAVDRLRGRALIDAAGTITPTGRALRAHIEDITDRLAGELLVGFDHEAQRTLLAAFDGLVDALEAAQVIPFPNPMGLPRRAGAGR